MCPLQAVFFTSTCAINWPKYGIFSRVVCISEIDVWVQDASNEYTKASSKIVSRNNRFSGGSFSKYLVGTNWCTAPCWALGAAVCGTWSLPGQTPCTCSVRSILGPPPGPLGQKRVQQCGFVRLPVILVHAQAESHQPWGLLLSVPHRLAVSLSAAHVSASPGLLRCKCSWIL